ncbi:MAG: hypothetical protein SOV20_08760 [Coriobacteriales bacterium]|nr:hypothetical protein [Coriobacteriales bacterium]
MPTAIKGQPTSAEVIARLKAEDRPVLLAFSCGKDSLGAWCALRDAGIEVIPAYMWLMPHLGFVDEEIAHYEELFGTRIRQYPHPSFWRLINRCVMQTPARLRAIATLGLVEPTYEETWAEIKDDLGLPQDTWVADGVRAADSIARRASFVRNGVMKCTTHKVSPIADVLKGELMELLGRHGVDLPRDYEIWGRSFDGIDYRFSEPMSRELPEDFETVRRWFPLVDAEIYRGRYISEAVKDVQSTENTYLSRNKNEQKRRDIATDGAAMMRVCFRDKKSEEKFEQVIGSSDRIIPHELLEAAFPEQCDGRRAQRVAEPRLGRLGASPLDSLEESDDLEDDSYLEAECCLEMLEYADSQPNGRAFTDTSDFRVCVFPTRDDLESFCLTRRLMRFGMLYVDGDRWMSSVA